MTDELKPFSRKELREILSEKERKASDENYANEAAPPIIRKIYEQFRRHMENMDNRKPYISEYTIHNLNMQRYTNVNEIVLARVRELFPDFLVDGHYVDRDNGDVWFSYEITVSWF
jgi:hypothetical protein